MRIEDLARVEQVFHHALDLDAEARSSFLAEFSPNDEWLIGEVRSLLRSYHSSPRLLEDPAYELGLAVMDEPQAELLTGQTIGYYEIRGLLGKGGMGDVYLAADLHLNRKVALKFLSSAFSNDNWAKRQLVREAQAVAMLDHQNICAVYGYEEIGDHRFIVMQYVDGVSLAELLRDKKVGVGQIPQIALQIAEAIAEAHAHSIIHRDIKPRNIMIGTDGHVKVLDFGLAKLIQHGDKADAKGVVASQASRPGLILGTIAYMSPEQLRAEKLDYRSDIFSIGTVLFELVAGEHPFQKKNDAETISAIIRKKSPFDEARFSRMPMSMRSIVRKCLEKGPERRYQSATELVLDLQQPRMKRVRDLSYFYSRGLVAFLLIMSVLAAFMYFFRAERAYSMVIVPYRNETGDADLDYVADGFGDSLSTKLALSGKLRLRSLPSMPQNSEPDRDPITIGRDSGVEFVLSGKITKQNDRLVLRTNVLDVADGVVTREWNIPFQVSGMPALEDKVVEELYSGLKISESANLANTTKRHGAFTENGEASKQYLIGRYYWKKRDRDNIKLAIAAFEHAIELDPGYSRPYSGLSDCYVLLSLVSYGSMPASDAMTKARAAARQALELDPYDAPAHTSLGIVYTRYDWKWAEAENEFRLSIQTDADYAAAHYWYSDLLANLGRSEESVAEARKAKDLDPFSPLANYNLARTLYYARQYDKALEILNDPSGPGLSDKKIRYMLGLVYLQKGMYSDAQNVFENIMTENRMLGAAALGYTYAKLGRREDALKLIGELRKTSAGEYVPQQEIAIIYIGLQEKNNALRYLTDSFKERNAAIVALKVEPLFDPLRNDIRFITLLKEMGLR